MYDYAAPKDSQAGRAALDALAERLDALANDAAAGEATQADTAGPAKDALNAADGSGFKQQTDAVRALFVRSWDDVGATERGNSGQTP